MSLKSYSPETIQEGVENSARLAASIRDFIKDDKIQTELHRLVMGKKLVPLVDYFEKQNMIVELNMLNTSLYAAFSSGSINEEELFKLSGWIEDETVKMRRILKE